MPSLNELFFLEVHLQTGRFHKITSDQNAEIHGVYGNRQLAENAVIKLYESRNFLVGDIDQRRKSPIRHALDIGQFHEKFPDVEQEIPTDLPSIIRNTIRNNEDISDREDPLNLIDTPGIPDLVICDPNCSEWFFAEVKYQKENLLENQREWFNRFNYLGNRIVVVFPDENEVEQYKSATDVETIFAMAVSGRQFDDLEEREEMQSEEIADILQSAKVGDDLIFNDKIEPLRVVQIEKTMTGKATLTGVEVESQQGKTYLLSYDGESYLDPWNKRSLMWVGFSE